MKIYVIHHSHTDLGYTDLQERVLFNQVNYIKTAIAQANSNFIWNCETYFCVERFLAEATEQEKSDFFEAVKSNHIGISATYLNFSDLVDVSVLTKRTAEMVNLFAERGITITTAMNADVNGISLGSLDAYVDNGIEFFYTNIHCHHGMYPLYQNMKPYYWENHAGKKLLVWNGEHYNLGNALGLLENKNINYMTENYFGVKNQKDPILLLKNNIDAYIKTLKESDYPYDFVPISVSGVFSDNAPPNPKIFENITKLNALYPNKEVEVSMVTLNQLYNVMKNSLGDEVPTYRGDLNDWWAHGVASTPYLVKHYREAERIHQMNQRLDPKGLVRKPNLDRDYEDNSLIYAEHTWGHSATITNPFDSMVLNLDVRKNAYASKAHEAVNLNHLHILHNEGDIFRYYGRSGRIKAINTGKADRLPVSFYIEVLGFDDIEIIEESSNTSIQAQISSHPRGVLISFTDTFKDGESKYYRFKEVPKKKEVINSRVSYIGSERVKDIVNEYDPISYKLPYGIENDFYAISYTVGKGVTSFYDKKLNKELLIPDTVPLFTPIYEVTEIRTDEYEERRLLGRNIRGIHGVQHTGVLSEVKVLDIGAIFSSVEMVFALEGTKHCSVLLKLYNHIPRIDFSLKLAKTLSSSIESVYLPLGINHGGECFLDKGGIPFRPGIDQIPGTCMEYYLLSQGVSYVEKERTLSIACLDAPMVYMGDMKHHPITLCDGKPVNNRRPVYSWVMNNCWETNFKMDLSGITEYNYTLFDHGACNEIESFEKTRDKTLGVVPVILESE